MAEIWRNLDYNKRLINEASRQKPMIFFDVETTGLGKDAEVIELAAAQCIFKDGMFWIQSLMDLFIKPQNPVPKQASDVNGITNEFLEDKMTEAELFPYIFEFFGDSPAVSAYNSAFDIRNLAAMYKRQGKELNVCLDMDMYKIAKDVFCCQKLKDMKLETVATTYGVDKGITFHSAIDDVWVLIRVTNAVIEDIKRNSIIGNEVDVRVNGLYYREGYRGDSRLYVHTSSGSMYYAFKEDKWLPSGEDTKLQGVRMDQVEKQVFAMTETDNYKDLKKYCDGIGTGKIGGKK